MFPPFIYTLLALAPLGGFLYLLLIRKLTLLTVSFITAVFYFLLIIFFWPVSLLAVTASSLKAIFVAFDILLILFGALLFLEIIKTNGTLDRIVNRLSSVSTDIRVQVVLLAWFFVSFIEGTAGFGTPAALAAPLLVSLGVTPLNAVLITLLGNSTSGVFGAVGTPIRLGFSGLNYPQLPLLAASYNIAGLLMPIFMVWILSFQLPQSARRPFIINALPFTLWSGFVFVALSFIFAHFGQEFPTILGSLLGFIMVYLTLRFGIFTPTPAVVLKPSRLPAQSKSFLAVFWPYLTVILLLIAGKQFLGHLSLKLPLINHNLSLFNPGFAFILAVLPILLFQKPNQTLALVRTTLNRCRDPFLVILLMSLTVQFMVVSTQNFHHLPSIIDRIAALVSTSFLVIGTPFIGAFGSFLTGSVTLSNLLFGNLLADAALTANLNVARILALQIVGAAAGNMIALADVLAAQTVVGLKHHERQIIKGVALPCLAYLIVIILLALVL